MMSRPAATGAWGLLLNRDSVVSDCRTTGAKSLGDNLEGGRWPLAVSSAIETSLRMTAVGVAKEIGEYVVSDGLGSSRTVCAGGLFMSPLVSRAAWLLR